MSFEPGSGYTAAAVLALWTDVAVKGSLVLLAGWIATRALRRRSAAVRHVVWLTTMAGLLLLPGLSVLLPAWRVLPAGMDVRPAIERAVTPRPVVVAVAADGPTGGPGDEAQWMMRRMREQARRERIRAERPESEPVSDDKESVSSSPAAVTEPAAVTGGGWPWLGAALLAGWGLGAAMTIGPAVIGMVSLRRLERQARRVESGRLLGKVAEIAAIMGLRRGVVLLESDRRLVPMTWGMLPWRRARVLLPGDWSSWPAGKLRSVLVHELAHVKRMDCLSQFAARMACAAHWFNPLAWYGQRRLRLECEQACDDLVLHGGERATEYARELLRIASELGVASWGGQVGIAMARRSMLEGRLLAILDAKRDRRAVTRGLVGTALVLLLAIVGPMACMRAAEATDDAAGKEPAEEATPAFGPVIERTVLADRELRRDMLIDLDSGRLLTEPAGLDATNPDAVMGWLRQNGVDAASALGQSVRGLVGMDMIVLPVEKAWETWAAAEVWNNPQWPHSKPGTPAPMSTTGTLPATFLFQTRDGGRGILQITGYTEHAKDGADGVKIRYRLVQVQQEKATGANEAPATAGDQAHGESTTVSSGSAAPADVGRAPRVLNLRIFDAQTGRPVSGVKVEARFGEETKKYLVAPRRDGLVPLALPEPLNYASILVEKRGYVPMRVVWSELNDSPDQLPGVVDVPMERGTSIGGIIQDEQGRPIAGAIVYVLLTSDGPTDRTVPRPSISDVQCRTDNEGRWRCDIVPAKFEDVSVRLVHPDFVCDVMYNTTPRPPVEQLRAMTGVMVMKKGVIVTGEVLDERGGPITGATVAQGGDRFGSEYPRTTTDTQGRFEFGQASPGVMTLTVQAKGHGPELKQVMVQPGMPAVEVRLGPGGTIHGRVVDDQGRPVAGVGMVIDTWRGARSLMTYTTSDAQGRFMFEDAPLDTVQVDAYQNGYMSARKVLMQAGEVDHVVTLHPPLVFRGRVTIAATGEPAPQFTVTPGLRWDNARPAYFESYNAKSFKNGTFELKLNYPYPTHLFRIDAPGMRAYVSDEFLSSAGTQTFEVALEPAKVMHVTVRTPDGEAAGGADVLVAVPGKSVSIQDGKVTRPRNVELALKTGSDGSFELPEQVGPYQLVVVHDAGFLAVTPEQLAVSQELTLQAWGKIEGRAMIGDRPAANADIRAYPVTLYDGDEPQVYFTQQATTDGEGNFVMERTTPGEWQVARSFRVDIGAGRWMQRMVMRELVKVGEGQTARVTLGGHGRRITGRLIIPAEAKKAGDVAIGDYRLQQTVNMPPPPRPEGWDRMSVEEQQKSTRQWLKTPEGRAYNLELIRRNRAYDFTVNADGTFEIPDVSAGEYDLIATIMQPLPENQCGLGAAIAAARRHLTVADGLDGRTIEMGDIEMIAPQTLKAGDEAPGFEIKTLDGRPLRLADYRGRHVLLVFWATWCGPCREKMPELKALYEKLGGDERWVMVGLSEDDQPGTAAAYAKENGMAWPQGWIGQGSAVAKDYSVAGIPQVMLIDPQGRIAARDLWGKAVQKAVEEALAAK
ncbi:MAG: carboxypeptidase regulatory-like domain-containing protein [Phycisphaeraceae bacterium]|nr:carboxypeptidase regulatory-like domain-containing protein [Phycisphaeraceae bacterium]